jgi:hypothetical protein
MSYQKFLGAVGLIGPIYSLDNSTNTPLLDDTTGLPVVMITSGFYHVRVNEISFIDRTCTLQIDAYKSKKNFILKYRRPIYSITYYVSDIDQILDGSGNVTSAGKFTSFLDRSIVRLKNNSELDCALNMILSLNGSSQFQVTFPVDFTVMSQGSITQSNIDNSIV